MAPDVSDPSLEEALRRKPLQFRFDGTQHLWWVPSKETSGQQRRVILPKLNTIITDLAQCLATSNGETRLVVVYPTSRHNLLLPLSIALNYTAMELGYGSVVAWTPNPSFRDDYLHTAVGFAHPDVNINSIFPLSTQKAGSAVTWDPPGFPKPKGPPRLFHSSRPGYFMQSLPPGHKPLALVVDGNHRTIPEMIGTIESWATKAGIKVLVLVLTNPMLPAIRQLAQRGYHIIAWSCREAAEPALVQLASSNDPFLRSVAPLARLAHPDFHYEMEDVRDPDLEPILEDLARYIKGSESKHPDDEARHLQRYRKSAFRKLSTLAVPWGDHVAHHLGRFKSVSLERHVSTLLDMADRISERAPAEADRCREVARRVNTAIELLKRRPPAKYDALRAMVRESSTSVLIAVDNFAQSDAVTQAISDIVGDRAVQVARMQDLHLQNASNELWLLGAPTYFTAPNLRAGVSIRARILTYPVEREDAATLIRMAHLPSMSHDHEASRCKTLNELLGTMLEPRREGFRDSDVAVRLADGTHVGVRETKRLVSIGRLLQDTIDWNSSASEDSTPPVREAHNASNVEPKDQVKLVLDNAPTTIFHKDDLLLRITGTVGQHEIVTASRVRVGDRLFISSLDARQNVMKRLMDQLEEIPEIGVRVHLARRWGERLKKYKGDKDLTYNQLFEQFKQVIVNDRPTKIQTAQTIRTWAEGMVIGPAEDEDLIRIHRLLNDEMLTNTLDRTIQAVHDMRGLQKKIIRHIMKEAMEGTWEAPVVLDEEMDVHFSDFEGLFSAVQVLDVKKGGAKT